MKISLRQISKKTTETQGEEFKAFVSLCVRNDWPNTHTLALLSL